MLEDMEEKRSVHSSHSFHSRRSSRSHQGWHRPHSQELGSPLDPSIKVVFPASKAYRPNGSYTNMALVIHENSVMEQRSQKAGLRPNNKSRSAENISMSEASEGETSSISLQRASPNPPSPRTFSASDIQVRLYETAI